VEALQQQLIRLGFLSGEADGDFGPLTAQALRDAQRRLGLEASGAVEAATAAALAVALARQPPSPTSEFCTLHRQVMAEAARGLYSSEKLPFLDRGIAMSPFRADLPRYSDWLADRVAAAELRPYPAPADAFSPYPGLGVVPPIISGRGGLDFLSDAVAQACVCVGSFAADRPLRVRWFGRRALEDNVQFWSASKFVAPLMLVCHLHRRHPDIPIGDTIVRSLDGSRSESFAVLFRDMVTYAAREGEWDGGSSNRIAYMFKKLLNAGEPDVETWLRSITGNPAAQLLSWYGQWQPDRDPSPQDPPFFNPYAHGVELRGPEGVLVGQRELPRTRNWLSAYDLTRLLSMLGWHHALPAACRLPAAEWSSLATLVEGLGHDPARYLDVALERLGLLEAVAEPVILSKLGYGDHASDIPKAPALTYVAFASFRDRRSTPARQRSFALALRIPTSRGLATALEHDVRMAAEVTEIVRRIFAEELV
jgi:hypothetical protein